jgi:flagellar biosynthesis chaperone FliJ
MKKFQFPFQKAMDWRERCAEQSKSELEKLHGVREDLNHSRLNVRNELDRIGRQNGAQSCVTAEDLHQMAAFTTSLRNLDGRLKAEESQCALRIEKQQAKCIVADRDHKLLVQLHDTSHRRWSYEADREVEQVAADSWNAGRARELGRRVPEVE